MFDAVVIGAGPAGGQCARELAAKGKKVLLAEKAASFEENNYSSGAAPLEMMNDFSLPESTVGIYWNRFTISSTNEESSWDSEQPLGVVLEFDKLRRFLADDAVEHGAELRLACQYRSHRIIGPKEVEVILKNRDAQEEFAVRTRVVVDATGTERKLFGAEKSAPAMGATGIEYHIKVDPKVYAPFAGKLHFFLGCKWMPQGYGWIFPKTPGELKVGIARYYQDQHYVPHEPSYKVYLERLLEETGEGSFTLLDRHGKTIHYTYGQKDRRLSGPVIAIGDAISSINPLGCEGIRHALVSGRFAAQEIDKFLAGKVSDMNGYEKLLNRYFGVRWRISELMMHSLYRQTNDRAIDHLVRNFNRMDSNTLMDVIFRYRFHRAIPSYFFTYLDRFKDAFSRSQ